MVTKKGQVKHPIGVVVRRTGVPADLLRAWEKRYQAVVPERTATGRRIYSDADIERLRLMKRLIAGKRRISDVAGHSLAELTALLAEDQREAVADLPQPSQRTDGNLAGRSANRLANRLADCLDAVEALDAPRLAALLSEASIDHSPSQMRQELLAPLMARIGEKWQAGELRIVHEHMASAIVRAMLDNMTRNQPLDPAAPILVATTPAGQAHEIGIMFVVAAAQELGWRTLYLGPNLPAEEIVAGLRSAGADTLALSLVYPPSDPRTADELRRIRHLAGADVRILIGGRASPSYRDVIAAIGAVALEGLPQLQESLASMEPLG